MNIVNVRSIYEAYIDLRKSVEEVEIAEADVKYAFAKWAEGEQYGKKKDCGRAR